jgi:vacuolar protein sorting-associated protein 13A/C
MVFESLLERVLVPLASEYVTGIDKNNLKVGIWSGNVVIENVSLKKNLVDKLELPINI